MQFRALTYNIRSGSDALGRGRLVQQGCLLRELAPDLVLLQEVGGRSQAERLAEFAGLAYLTFGAARRSRWGEFGNAILARRPLRDVAVLRVPSAWPGSEPRSVLAATLGDGRQALHVISTHFGLLPGEADRAARTVRAIAAAREGPLLLGGDLNRAAAAAACHRHLRQTFVDCARVGSRAAQPTFPALRPVLRLDYLYARGLLVGAVAVVASSASDHRPVLADLRLPSG